MKIKIVEQYIINTTLDCPDIYGFLYKSEDGKWYREEYSSIWGRPRIEEIPEQHALKILGL